MNFMHFYISHHIIIIIAVRAFLKMENGQRCCPSVLFITYLKDVILGSSVFQPFLLLGPAILFVCPNCQASFRFVQHIGHCMTQSDRRDLNSQHPAWRAGALPIELLSHTQGYPCGPTFCDLGPRTQACYVSHITGCAYTKRGALSVSV